MATTPSSTVMIEMTIATMGRLTKKRAMIYLASPAGGAALPAGVWRCRLGGHRHAFLYPLEAFDDDLFAWP